METKVKKREWVKTALIIFLAVLLVLTFFSNTILNASLPEVAAQLVEGGQINARIRGQGTVSANETYDVTISQTRKVGSVLVKVGQTVQAGDVLFLLESEDSEELKAAQEQLTQMELSYEKSLIEAGNAAAQENREVQQAQQAYNEALALYNQYSALDASTLIAEKAKAEAEQKELDRAQTEAEKALSDAENERTYQDALTDLSSLKPQLDSLEDTIETLEDQLQSVRRVRRPNAIRDDLSSLDNQYANALMRYEADYLLLMKLSGDRSYIAEEYVANSAELSAVLAAEEYTQSADDLIAAYDALKDYYEEKAELETELEKAEANETAEQANEKIERQLSEARSEYRQIQQALSEAEAVVAEQEKTIKVLRAAAENARAAAEVQQAYVQKLEDAAGAAETVKSARKALEDLIFQNSLGDSSALDMQAAADEIEKQKEQIEALKAEADGQEVTAKVSGVIASISVSAGNTVGAETPLAGITVADRGYTIKIPVTAEQARKVKIGDTAELVNYWGGDVTAVLEQVASDPADPQNSKLLIFKLTGDVTPDQNLTLSIGQKSAGFDALVPNSAVHTDNNGDFVLMIVAKSTPLSTRYTAKRVDVQVLARDDTLSAVSGVAAGDFVITTSAKPIEAGAQVRLVDNG